jgi:hypothetical protein
MVGAMCRLVRFLSSLTLKVSLFCLICDGSTARLQAFSLLGPYEDWMDVTNGFRQFGDIGGPMNLGQEYRWNVPVLTYGFDKSFLDYFGSNGVAAVESAISVINNLPPASAVVLTNFPTYSQSINYSAQAQNLWDLKSAALASLLAHLGLAQPTRYVYSIRAWSTNLEPYAYIYSGLAGATDIINKYLVLRNFDPQSLQPSEYVNGTFYTGYVYYTGFGTNGVPTYADVDEVVVDPLARAFNAVADDSSNFGTFYTGLTYDDVGAISFLLSTNRFHTEGLITGVQSASTNRAFVNSAVRPGVDKIAFIAHPTDSSGAFQPLTNFFTDAYITNGQILHQQLERVALQPDFLFMSGDTGKNTEQTLRIVSTGTSNWINNSILNGGVTTLGPGVIAPPVKITFHQLGGYVFTREPAPEINPEFLPNQWGSFDRATNASITYPNLQPGTPWPLSVRLRLPNSPDLLVHTWQLALQIGGTASLQTSTNLSDWLPVMTVTNNGTVVEWFDYGPFRSNRFFRVTPQ